MNAYEVCNALWERAFGPEFGQVIREDYREDDFGEIEEELRVGKEKLLCGGAQGRKEELQRAERLYDRAAQVTAENAFFAGLFAGFRHYFTPGKYDDLSFHELVALGQLNGMTSPATAGRRALEHEANRIVEALSAPDDPDLEEHIISVSCGWGQRVYYAGYVAFRLGYRSAWDIVRAIDPAVTCDHVTSEVLRFEKEGGYMPPRPGDEALGETEESIATA